ncbi:simple sugar transport system permease protein [Anaerobranca californiensis DSM 14826]|jgi:simple sugar transport system permease protein|uniref:Simple sugar transport system permease protein n=1 Tax=Anaerobranca californiensis DSM 14826 TaxID=1120989 RepID=A0A1M6QWE1_9FIRM|nr:ABC transporter [Anaerobranca californiensis]SHK24506.1 simple sugar transport system permease protein [Anaerobranca californiensis DSM 14826]
MGKSKLQNIIEKAGWPRLIIAAFLLSLIIAGYILKLQMSQIIGSMLVRTGMNGILVLAMIPSIRVGAGPNFGLPLGIICGLLGAVISIELGFIGFKGFTIAILISLPLSILCGYLYGLLLNKVKGQEMLVGTYLGFSVVSGICMFWARAPFTSPLMIWPYGGVGLRVTISIEEIFDKVLNNFMKFSLFGVTIPTGLLLTFALFCVALGLFHKTKTGIGMKVAGSNPAFAKACGLNVDRYRILGIILSTVLGAIGILVYAQSFGFLQLYLAPLFMAFPVVAAILIGGATLKRATIAQCIVGTFLFQSLLVIALPIANELITGNLSEVTRIIIMNGIILYALTRKSGGEH